MFSVAAAFEAAFFPVLPLDLAVPVAADAAEIRAAADFPVEDFVVDFAAFADHIVRPAVFLIIEVRPQLRPLLSS